MNRPFLITSQTILENTLAYIRKEAESYLRAGKELALTLSDPARSQEQNRLMWPYLEAWRINQTCIVNGVETRLDRDDWKDVLTASWRRENIRMALGLDGGVVMLGARTSKFRKGEFTDWMEFLIYATTSRGMEPVFKNPPANLPEPPGYMRNAS